MEWQMLCNADKCKVMHMGYNNMQAEYDTDNVKLECVSDEEDLGCHYKQGSKVGEAM